MVDTNMSTPACIGIILDGNRRWAKEKGLATLKGHEAGRQTLKRAVRFIGERGVKHLIVYAFSTENWHRAEEEVTYLLELFRTAVKEDLAELARDGARVRFVGQRERFSEEFQDMMRHMEEATAVNSGINLWVCFSYGGRAEITAAAKAAARDGDITEDTLSRHLWTAGMPDPDLIIRTGGNQRLSNFLPWQSVYSELFFTETYWPDFSETEFDAILAEYAARERRHGK